MSPKNVWLVLLLLATAACTERDLGLSIRYDRINGLTEGARVLMDRNEVGRVTGIAYTSEGDFQVKIIIRREFRQAATENSRFFIIVDPAGKERRAIAMLQVRPGGIPLSDGATVAGATPYSARLEKFLAGVEDRVGELQERIKALGEDVRRIPESEAVRKLERQLADFAAELQRQGRETREKLLNEVLPRLEAALENLRRRLHELGREDELEPLERQWETIREIQSRT